MSEEKDIHMDRDTLDEARTNRFLKTRIDILNAESTRKPFDNNAITPSVVTSPISDSHTENLKHYDGDVLPLSTSPPAFTPQEGDLYWNAIDHTLNVKTDTDTIIQVGQEVVVRIINKTGGELTNGEVVYINGADVPADRPTAIEADASTWEDSQMTLGVMTSTVADDAEGFVTVVGLVRDVDTSGMTAGDRIYLSETTGEFTKTRPSSPSYIIEIGVVVKVDAAEGIIFVHPQNNDDHGFFNGTFVESFDLTVAEVGGNIVASLQRGGGGNLTLRFSDGFSTLVTAPMTKNLTAGTAINPQANYLYILQSDKTQMTLSTSGYPTAVEHIKIAKVVVFTAAITATDDALANQNVNDHAADNIPMGHLSHLGEWIRAQPASWVSGVAGNSATGDDYLDITAGPDAAFFVSTAGTIRQLHLQSYAARDNTDWVYVINDPDAAYTRVTELIAGIDKLSTGVAIGNNKYFALVFWGIQNKSGETSQLICNLPAGQYNSQLGAENDINGFTNVDIPGEFRSTGFLICKLVIQLSGATWVYKSTLDLRGTNPSIVTGAGGGSAIVSFPDNTFEIFDSDDPTKLINFQASGITAGNTRVATMPDTDLIIAGINVANVFTQNQDIQGNLTLTGTVDGVEVSDKDIVLTRLALFSEPNKEHYHSYPRVITNGVVFDDAVRNDSSSNMDANFELMQEVAPNGFKLWIDAVRVTLSDAAEGDEVDRIIIYGNNASGQVAQRDSVGGGALDFDTATQHEWEFTDLDVSTFPYIGIRLLCLNSAANELDIVSVDVKGHYLAA